MLPAGELAQADTAPPPQAEPEELEAVPLVAPPPPPPPPPMPSAAPASTVDEEHMVAQYEWVYPSARMWDYTDEKL